MRTIAIWGRVHRLGLVVAILVICCVAYFVTAPSYRRGVWPVAGGYAAGLAFYLGAVATAISAWVSSGHRRFNLEALESASTRAPAYVQLPRLAAVVGGALVALGVGLVASFVSNAVDGVPPGVGYWLSYALLAVANTVFAVIFGWLCGTLLQPVYGTVMAVVLLLGIFLYAPVESGMAVSGSEPWEAPALGPLAIRVLAIGLFALAAVVAPGIVLRRRSSRRLGQAIPCVALAAVLWSLWAAAPVIQRRPPPAQPTCVAGRVEVCVWPENEKLIPMIESFGPKVDSLPQALQLPTRLYEYGLIEEVFTVDGSTIVQPAGVQISEGNPWSLASSMAIEFVHNFIVKCGTLGVSGNDGSADRLGRWIEFTLMESSEPDYTDQGVPESVNAAWEEADRVFTSFSPGQQEEWVLAQLELLATRPCPGVGSG